MKYPGERPYLILLVLMHSVLQRRDHHKLPRIPPRKLQNIIYRPEVNPSRTHEEVQTIRALASTYPAVQGCNLPEPQNG